MAPHKKRYPGPLKPLTLALITSLASLGTLGSITMAAPPAPTELPTGGTVAAGTAAISHNAANMTINQSSNKAIINWNTFNIGSQASVAFNQPSASAVTLNRVLSSDPSAIYGRLTANGQIFLVNPAGIVFGPGASVNTSGIVASTLNLTDQNFLNGNYRFERNGSTGSILNQGTITANNGGYIALLAPEVRNEGILRAHLGTVAMAAGDAVTLSFDPSNQLRVAVDPATLKTLIENNHIIQADGGTVIMASSAASDLLGSVIKNTGVIEANSIGSINGQVVLSAEKGTATLEGTGRIDARGTQDGQTGGTVKLLGTQVGMLGNSAINVSGASGGGNVIIGGNFHGEGPEANAMATYIGPDATIKADATNNGNGGRVAVWADNATGFYGAISAQGGTQGGDGGFVETSGKQFLDFQGVVNTSAPRGTNGTLLLDPTDITISAAANTGSMVFNGGTFTFSDAILSPSNLNVTTLTTQLGLSNVTVSTASGLTGNGDISVNAPVAYTSANSLTLKADRNIIVVGNSVSNAGAGAIILNATGDLNVSSATISGQSIAMTANNINIGAAGATAATSVTSTGLMSVNAAGTLTLRGANAGVGNSAVLSSAGGQNITVGGIAITGGNGTNNFATIQQTNALANQSFAITGGGVVSLQGGGGTGNRANIFSQGALQNINFVAGGNLTLTGGNGASTDNAEIGSSAGKQTISGAPTILLTGGTGGGGALTDSNHAIIFTGAGAQDQTITAAGITITGGAGGTRNRALILHDGTGAQTVTATSIAATGGGGVSLNEAGISQGGVLGTQSVNVSGGGTLSLQGGTGTSNNAASIFNKGTQQTINFTAGGALNLTGGTVGNFNNGRVESIGQQTISGAPNITLQGGASGGAVGFNGNAAEIRAEGTTQTISANNLLLQGGAGISASASIEGRGTDVINVAGTTTLTGGSGVDAAALIGNSLAPASTTINSTGAMILTGGAGTVGGDGLGGNVIVGGLLGLNGDVTINGQAGVTFNQGGGPGFGTVKIGTGGSGDLVVKAGLGGAGSLALNAAQLSTTTGKITLQATAAGGQITQSAAGFAKAATLSASSNAGITLNGANAVDTFNASNAGVGATGNIALTNTKALLTVTGISNTAPNGNITVTQTGALTTTGAISTAANGNITLTASGAETFQNSVVAGGTGAIALTSASDIVIQDTFVFTTGAATVNANGLTLKANALSASLNAGTTQNITVGAGGLTLSGAGGAVANGSAQITQTDAAGTQNITVNGGGGLSLTGGAGSGNNNSARISAAGTAQSITFSAGGNLVLTGGTIGNSNRAEILATNATVAAQTQSIVGATGITMTGGASGGGIDVANNSLGNRAQINNNRGSQTISVGSGGITMNGGGGPLSDNAALILQGSSVGGVGVSSAGTSQTITVNNGGTISLTGGSTAQSNVINNVGNLFRGSFALIHSRGDAQTINFTSGGAINLTGGTVGSNNPAQIFAEFGNQTITGAPNITLVAGASGGTGTEGNSARISTGSTGTGNQTIAAGTINITGGSGGINNEATIIDQGAGSTQTVTATGITLRGGTGGGLEGPSPQNSFGSSAQLRGDANQDITVGAGGLTVIGGSGPGADHFAQVRQGSQSTTATPGTFQKITVNNGGAIVLQGGSTPFVTTAAGNGSYGRIRGEGDTQTINFTSGGAISITGGSVGTSNQSEILTNSGSQTITGSPNLTMNAGSSGGANNDGNFARMRSDKGPQNLTLGSVQMTGGGGIDTFAIIQAPNQNINVNGNLTMTGSSGGSGGAGSSIGGLTDGVTNLSLTVKGNITLNGGAITNGGSAIGPRSNSASPQTGNVTINADGDITLNGGSAAGTRIGQPNGLVGGGDITVTSGGNIVLGGNGTTGGNIRTLGNVILHADATGKSITQQAGSTLQANTLTTTANAGLNLSSATNAVSIFGGTIPNTGDLTFNNTGPLTLTAGNYAGNLTVVANGAVTQSGAVTVAGATNVNAGANAITLTNANNDFQGAVSLSGSAVQIVDKNQLVITVNATGPASVTGNLTYAGTSGDLTLNATATPVGTLIFGNTVVNGNLVATAADAVSQTAGTTLTVTGTTLIDALSNNKSITLGNAGNDFGGLATFRGSNIQVADSSALNAAVTGSGFAFLDSAGAMSLSGSTVGLSANAGGAMTVGGISGGTGVVHLVSAGDMTLNNSVFSNAGGDSVILASRAGNFINNAGANAVRVPATGRFLVYSGSPQLDTLNGLTAPETRFNTLFDPTLANITFTTSGFLYRSGASENLQSVQTLQSSSGNAVPPQRSPDVEGTKDPLQIALCMSSNNEASIDQACESVRRNARNIRYRVAIETLRNNPTVADIPLCGPNAPEVCMPVKQGVVDDAALGQPQLNIPGTDVRRKVAYLFGNNDYRNGIEKLQTPIADVGAIGKVLQDRLGYEVTIVPNATKATMVRILTSIAEKTAQDESVLIFYAGHGYQMDESKAGFWIPTDGSPSDPRTWLSNNDVQRFLNRTEAKQIAVISDSCFSGTLAKEQALDAPKSAPKEQLLTRRAVVTLTSGDEEPVSDEGLDGHSIFAYHFLGEMRRIQKLSPITASFERLRERVAKSYPQTPQLGAVLSAGHMSGASYLFEVK